MFFLSPQFFKTLFCCYFFVLFLFLLKICFVAFHGTLTQMVIAFLHFVKQINPSGNHESVPMQ